MNCPACSAALRPLPYEGTQIHTCDACGGEFVGPHALAHIVNTRDAQVGPSTARPAPGAHVRGPGRTLACAACAAPTTELIYALDTGVRVDRCTACGGVWLDSDELEHIQAILEEAEDAAPERLAGAAPDLARARRQSRTAGAGAFQASRFSFVNAIVNRLLDAA